MAYQSRILTFPVSGVTGTLTATTASSGITLGQNAVFAINATQDIEIVCYPSGSVVVPSATVGFRIPANATYTIDMGTSCDTFAIYNAGSVTATYSYQLLSIAAN